MFRSAALCHDGVDEGDHLLVHLVSFKNRVNHGLLRHFVGASLNHDNFLSCGSHGQSQIGRLLLLLSRVDDELAIHQTYLCGGAWAVKRNV